MPVKIGDQDVAELFVGDMGIKHIMIGDTEIYSRPGSYFYIKLDTTEE